MNTSVFLLRLPAAACPFNTKTLLKYIIPEKEWNDIMTTQQMQYIIALTEEGNFSAAAKKLFVTQPSISQLIKNMESQIGTPLFDRSTTPVKLTTVGKAYYEAAKKIESINRELDNRVSEINNLKSGSLTIGTSPFRASCMLPKSISYFKEQYPGIQIRIVTDHIESLKQQLMDGEIDICIDNDVFENPFFITEELAGEMYYLALNKNNPWNTGKESLALTPEDILSDSEKLYNDEQITAEAIEKLPFILLDAKSEHYDISLMIFEKLAVEPPVSMYASNIETKFHWVNSNLGAAFLPDTLIRFGNFIEHPVYYKIQEPKNSLGLCQEKIVVAYNKNHFLTKAAREYILLLKKLIGMGTWLLQ